MIFRVAPVAVALSMCLVAEQPQAPDQPPATTPAQAGERTQENNPGWKRIEQEKTNGFVVQPGTRVPLSMINSVSTKTAAEGDRVYLETVFPILVNGRVVIPPGSYVAGTVTQVKRPGRVKGRGELYVRFDSLTLPNGVTRDFRARIGALDGRAGEDLDKEEGKLKGAGNKGGDARTIGEAAGAGASVGAIAGSVGGRPGMGVGLGAASGAAAGLVGVLLSRGPEAMLTKGTTVDMVLDRQLVYEESEVDFGPMTRRPQTSDDGPLPSQKTQEQRRPIGRFPF
jgi:type IV secretion system protein VirB10